MAAEILQLPALDKRPWSDNELLLILASLKGIQIIAHRENCHVMQNQFLVEYVVSDEGDEGLMVSLMLQTYASRFYYASTGDFSPSQTETVPHAIWERQQGINYVKWYQPYEYNDSNRSVRRLLEERHHSPLPFTLAVMAHHADCASEITNELRNTGSLLLSTVDERDNNLWDSSFLSEIAEPGRTVNDGC